VLRLARFALGSSSKVEFAHLRDTAGPGIAAGALHELRYEWDGVLHEHAEEQLSNHLEATTDVSTAVRRLAIAAVRNSTLLPGDFDSTSNRNG